MYDILETAVGSSPNLQLYLGAGGD